MAHDKIIVLDRDGVINQDSVDFIKTPAEFVAIPGSIEAIASLSSAGYRVVIATNQSGVGRGLFNQSMLRHIHAKLIGMVEGCDGYLSAIYVCPHHPDDGCGCRKPKAGLLRRLASDFEVNPATLTMIGDSSRDLAAAQAVGARRVLVRTGNGTATEAEFGGNAVGTDVFDDLRAAAQRLVIEAGRI